MPSQRLTVHCPRCRTKLLVSPTRTRVACPKCGAEAEIRDGEARPAAVATLKEWPPPGEADFREGRGKERPAEGRLGVFRYFLLKWHHDRGGVFFKLVLALLTAALLSLLKPRIGHRGILSALAALAAASVLAFVVYAISRIAAYSLRAEQDVDDSPRSLLARFAYFGFIAAAFAWGPVAVADYFSPDRGWLAQLFPAVADQQARLLSLGGPLPPVADEPAPRRAAAITERPESGNGERSAVPPRAKADAPGRESEAERFARIEADESARIEAEKRAQLKEAERIKAQEQTDDLVIQQLVENLKSRDAAIRAQAGLKFQTMGDKPAARAAIPALIHVIVEDVDEGDYRVDREQNKTAALEALKVLDPAKVKSVLLQAGKAKSNRVRFWAVEKLTEQPEGK